MTRGRENETELGTTHLTRGEEIQTHFQDPGDARRENESDLPVL